MIAETLIFVPLIANFRLAWLNDRLAAAYTAALASTPIDAAQLGQARGLLVGRSYPLGNGSLVVDVDAREFGQGGRVQAAASYTITGRDLFLFEVGGLTLSRQHAEPIGLHRSLP